MALSKITKISLMPLVTVMPIVYAVTGIAIGFLMIFILPNNMAANLSMATKLLAWAFFVLLYTLATTLVVWFIGFVYNVIAPKIGINLTVNIEKEDF